MGNKHDLGKLKRRIKENEITINRLARLTEKLSEAIFGNRKNKSVGLVRAYDDIDTRSLALYRILEEQKVIEQGKFLGHITQIQKEVQEAKEDAMYLQSGFQRKEKGTVSESGDLLIIDLSSTIDGKGHPGDKQHGLHVIIGQNMPFKGFDENLIGVTEGQDVEFAATPPDDFPIEEMRGKLVLYKVKVVSLRTPVKQEEPKPEKPELKVVEGEKKEKK